MRGVRHGPAAATFLARRALVVSVPTILFVCVENTFRSVLSEALFNAHAPQGWRAESAGVSPVAAINPVVVPLLEEVGIRLGPKVPRGVTPALVGSAYRVVTFGCLDRCPRGAEAKSEDWPVDGATGKTMAQLRAIRDDLAARVAELVASLPPADRGPS